MGNKSKRPKRPPQPQPQMAGSPFPFKLAGEMLVMSPLDDRDWGALESWMQERVIKIARDKIRSIGDLDDFAKKCLYETAMREAAEIGVASPRGAAVLVTLDGAAMMTWLGLRREHPGLTFEQVRERLLAPRNIEDAMDAFDAANGFGPRRNPMMTTSPYPGTGSSTDIPPTGDASTSPSHRDTASVPTSSAG